MNPMKPIILRPSLYGLLLLITFLFGSCDSFLDESPDKKLALPSTLQDMQALLDNHSVMNQNSPAGSSVTSADNIYLPSVTWNAMSNESERRKYTWEKDNLFRMGYRPNHWYNVFQPIYHANTVLESLSGIPRTAANASTWDDVKGQASFYRGEALLAAAYVWALAYDEATASTDLGLPLRLGTSFHEQLVRASVRDTYEQVMRDLREAATLLPAGTQHPVRPSKPAAYAVLARACLSMRKYVEAGAYADSSLALYDGLLDYNQLSATPTYPLPAFNAEVLHHNIFGGVQSLTIGNARVDTLLYASYAADDLRRTLFFRRNADGTNAFRGSYAGSSSYFAGAATNEVYLIQAEARARTGDVTGAMESLNKLLRTRWKTDTFQEYAADNAAGALELILQERRKELLFRGLRWMDIKRLNREGAGIALQRVLNGNTYLLPPGDPRFALAIPEDVIEQSGMQQNPR